MNKRKMIFDTDPGIDDALAICLACRLEEIDLLGVCAVAGNTPLKNTYANALNIMKLCGRQDVPVLRGSSKPLKKALVSDASAHGENGLDGYEFHQQIILPEKEEAVDFMIEQVKQYPHEVTIVAVGPLTNLAVAIARDDSFKQLVKGIVVMGGAAFVSGNVSPTSEFNFKTDPDAVKIVIESGIDVSIIPLDITLKTRLKELDWMELGQLDNCVAKFISTILKHRFECLKARGEDGYPMHDPLTIGAFLHPEWIEYEDYHMQIETCLEAISEGMCIVDRRNNAPEANVHIGVGVQSKAFIEWYKETIGKY